MSESEDARQRTRGRLRAAHAALVAGVIAATAAPVLAAAQARPPARPPAPTAKPPPAPSEGDAAAEEDATTVSEVVVNGQRRPQPGAVVGDIKPELQLSPAEIQSYGVSTVTELLDELAPETRSDRGRGGEAPVVLLNGRRISSFAEIRDIPTEAILRVDILPEEVALKYGYTANQRVVNIVLRRWFRAFTGEGSVGGPTEGGQLSGQAEADLLHIRGDNRLNLDLKYSASSSLTENERDLIPNTSGQPFALGGNVSSPSGGEIDPALSALAGHPVTVAGIPAGADGRPLTLADFAATPPNSQDAGRYRTLLPATQSLTANAVLSRAIFAGISATVNATLGATSSDTLQGLPSASLLVPAGNPYSPFRNPVLVSRYTDLYGPLRQSVDGWTGHLGSTLNRDMGKWRLSVTGAYDHADTRTDSDVGLANAALQALVGTSGFDPFAPLPIVALRPRDTARVQSDSANAQFLANGPLLQVPAGQLYASFKVGDSESLLNSRSERQGFDQSLSFSRNVANAQVNLDLPITSRRYHILSAVGDISLTGNAAIDQLSDFGTLKTIGYGVNWTPFTGINLIVSKTHDQAAPSQQQLGGPVVVTPGSRILDYVTGRTVDVTRIDGGNRALIGDTRDVLKIGLTLKPFASQQFTVSANYIESRIRNPIATFPAATADIEAAFPDRFVRDASGELTQVDYRPVNFASQNRKELRWGFDYSRPIGPQPQPRFRRPPGGWDGARWGGEGRPDFRRSPQTGQPPSQADSDTSTGSPSADQTRPSTPTGGDNGDYGPRRFGDGQRSFGGGGPRGGGRGGFGGGGFGGGGRLQFAVYHTVFFEDQILVRPGGPLLDLLNGSTAGSTGGQPRHEIEAQAGYLLNGLGARLSADWKSGTTVRGGLVGSPTGDLSFSGLATLNLRLFANFGSMRSVVQAHPFLRGSRLTFSINNLFDTRQRVRDANGQTPIGYQEAYLDPAGRTARIGFRKLFF